MIEIFGRIAKMEGDVKSYLYHVQRSALIFDEAIQEYMNDDVARFDIRLDEIGKLESEANRLRRKVRDKLYQHMLIPEVRGDVWELLESLHKLIDVTKKSLENYSFEKPVIPDFIKPDFLNMADYISKTVEQLVNAVSSYFTNITIVTDYSNKVLFFENEVDKVEDTIKKVVFSTDKIQTLAERIQLRYFAEKMALISDVAESVCEKLSVFVIRREI
jgi:predicted phosphate transport protein (TIGR00153 family)